MHEHGQRSEMVRYAHLVYRKGWVANHDGNLSVRVSANRFLATPTAFSKGVVDRDHLLVVDGEGQRVAGQTRIFSEIGLHLAVFRVRADVGAVVHAHPPYATGMACAGVGLETPFMPEAVVSLGPVVPLVPFAAPGGAAAARLNDYTPYFDAVMLESHGVLAWGRDLEEAFLRLELVEHLAQMATHAQAWGGVKALSNEVLGPLLAARRKAGLGPEARGLSSPPGLRRVAAGGESGAERCASHTEVKAEIGVGRDDLARVIVEELRALVPVK